VIAKHLDRGLKALDAKGNGAGTGGRKPGMIDQDLVKCVSHPTRVRVLEALQGRTASPTEMAKAMSESLGVISYHVNMLDALGAIDQTGTQPKRGTIEHFWTARPRSFIGHQDWREVPLSIRGGVTKEAFRSFLVRFAKAMKAGTIDARDDTTLNWMPVTVDDQGWTEVAELLDGTLRDLMRIAAECRDRLGGKDGIPIVTGLAAFEVPPGASEPG
jgi:hypothetical protein